MQFQAHPVAEKIAEFEIAAEHVERKLSAEHHNMNSAVRICLILTSNNYISLSHVIIITSIIITSQEKIGLSLLEQV